MITKIFIENVKGYSIPGKELHLNLDSTKVNLCVAPNGFGKSSMATAFESLNRNRLDVSEDHKNRNHRNEDSNLVVAVDGNDYRANGGQNDISKILKTFVIHNRTQVDYTRQKFRNIVNVNAFMEIAPVIVGPIVKPVSTAFYSISKIKDKFGKNKKIVHSIDGLLDDSRFCLRLNLISDALDKFSAQKRLTLINGVVDAINALKGNEQQVLASIGDKMFADLEANKEYCQFLKVYKEYFAASSKFEQFNVFFQLLYLWSHHRPDLNKLHDRAAYEMFRSRIDSNLSLLDSTGRNICTEEKDGTLMVVFPHADEISNGQRDVLTFVTELMVFKAQIHPGKKYLLIIDEVFDYLDDANTMAAQYYLSKILSEYSGNIYIMLLTHLNPFTFRNYIFGPKVINEIYLEETMPVATEDMMRFISFRQWLNPQKKPENKPTYDNLSCDIFHYNPNASDRSAEIEAYHQNGVKTTWGNPLVFRQVVMDELNKYLSGQAMYDPYAVALALRYRVEKVMYDSLPSQKLKDEFVDTHKTNKKLEFCEENNIQVQEVYYMVNAIHNDSDHLRQNELTGKFEEKAMVYKLQNKVIRNVIERLFGFDGNPLSVDVIS